ncbi:MAG: hypothetical protein RL026_1768 [Pseudomonadota bacterium]
MNQLAAPVVRLVVLCTLGFAGPAFAEPATALFKPVEASFQRQWDHVNQIFGGAAVIDVDGNGSDEVFVGGAAGQADALMRYQGGRLVDTQPDTGLSPMPVSGKAATYGATAVDLNNDGTTDLIVARGDGVTVYYNQGKRRFTAQKLRYSPPTNAVPFHAAVADVDKDGCLDLYIVHFVDFAHFRQATFNDPDHAKPNVMLRNKCNGQFEDVTKATGTAGTANTFDAVFTDLDLDGLQDLVVANNTGMVELFRNKGQWQFERHVPQGANAPFGFWMGIGVGDFNRDGRQDLLFPNVGTSMPTWLTRGDLKPGQTHTHDYLLLRNDGKFQFTDVTKAMGLGDRGFGWGAVFEDWRLTGDLQVAVAQNYIKWPVHKFFKLSGLSLVLKSKAGGGQVYEHDASLGVETKEFMQSSVVVDFNKDGRPDFLWLNMQGPLQAYANTSTQHFLQVRLPPNAQYLGTRVSVETQRGTSYTKEFLANQGMLTGQMPQLSFGLGPQTQASKVEIIYPNGEVRVLRNVPADTVIDGRRETH